MSDPGRPLVLWGLLDGRRGHENQVLGLAEALARIHPTEYQPVRLPRPGWRAIRDALLGAAGRGLPPPDLIVAAGHLTHLPLLLLSRTRRARSVCLMKPSLPTRLFDLCIVPAHDGVEGGERVLISVGALNRVRPAHPKDAGSGLLLVGGPAGQGVWDENAVLERMQAIVAADGGRRWTVASSRRTPPDFLAAVRRSLGEAVTGIDHETVDADWLPATLSRAEVAWVTEDSVSMVCEALSAGAAVGIIEVMGPEVPRSGRVAAGLDALVRDGRVTRASVGLTPSKYDEPLAEADRCARWITDRWFPRAA